MEDRPQVRFVRHAARPTGAPGGLQEALVELIFDPRSSRGESQKCDLYGRADSCEAPGQSICPVKLSQKTFGEARSHFWTFFEGQRLSFRPPRTSACFSTLVLDTHKCDLYGPAEAFRPDAT